MQVRKVTTNPRDVRHLGDCMRKEIAAIPWNMLERAFDYAIQGLAKCIDAGKRQIEALLETQKFLIFWQR